MNAAGFLFFLADLWDRRPMVGRLVTAAVGLVLAALLVGVAYGIKALFR